MFTKGAPWWLSFEFALSESDGPCCTSVELTDGTETFVDMCICTVEGNVATVEPAPSEPDSFHSPVGSRGVALILPLTMKLWSW
jgi:hypothetical protein